MIDQVRMTSNRRRGVGFVAPSLFCLAMGLPGIASAAELDTADAAVQTEGEEQQPEADAALIGPPPATVEEAEPRPAERKIGLTLIPSLRIPLGSPSENESGGGSAITERGADTGPVLALTARYMPVRNWFVQTTLYHYLDEEKRRPWNGDFSYGFGYENPKPNTFSVSYFNYTNNRFSPRDGDPVTRFDWGTASLTYKFRAPRAVQIDENLPVTCRAGYHVQPRYERASGSEGNWKQASSLGCTYPIWKMLYVEGTAYAYLNGEKQPWDPDFTYSFGWFDWRPGRFSIQYSNYSGNRYPWSDSRGTGGFRKGSVAVSWRAAF